MRNTTKHLKSLSIFGFVTALVVALIPFNANAAETPLTMGTSSTYGVLASSAVTSAAASGITGTAGADLGSGIAATGPLSVAGTTLVGGISAPLTAANAAFNDNRGGTVTGVELGAGATFTPGAYTNGTLEVNGTMTLNALGDPAAVFIFRASSTLITGTSSTVLLTGSAQACNVFWQVGSSATLGASSTMVGHVIALASISTGATSSVNGQLIALTGSVTLGGTTIVNNSCAAPVVVPPAPTATPTPTPAVVWSTYFSTCEAAVGNPPDGIGVIANTGASFALPGNTGSTTNPANATPMTKAGYTFAGWATSVTATTPLTGLFTPTGNSTLCALWTLVPVVVVPPTPTPTPTPTPVVTPTPTPTPVVTPTPVETPIPVVTPVPEVTPTTTGAELPVTATPYGNLMVLGLGMIVMGGIALGSKKVLSK